MKDKVEEIKMKIFASKGHVFVSLGSFQLNDKIKGSEYAMKASDELDEILEMLDKLIE